MSYVNFIFYLLNLGIPGTCLIRACTNLAEVRDWGPTNRAEPKDPRGLQVPPGYPVCLSRCRSALGTVTASPILYTDTSSAADLETQHNPLVSGRFPKVSD